MKFWILAAGFSLLWQTNGYADALAKAQGTPTCSPMLVQFFDLDEAQQVAWQRLRATLSSKLLRHWDPAGLREQECTAKIRALLTPAQRPDFDQAMTAVGAYWRAVSAANGEFRNAWSAAMGGQAEWRPDSWEAMAGRISNLATDDQKVFKATRSALLRRRRLELKELMKQRGLRPIGEMRAAYFDAYYAADASLAEQLWQQELPALRAKLSQPAADKVAALDAAYRARKAAIAAGLAKLANDLAGVFGPA